MFNTKKREAEGVMEMAKAYGALIDVLGGPDAFLQWKMIETGMYERLALANGQAIQGLQPKITTWNTGGKWPRLFTIDPTNSVDRWCKRFW